MAGMDPVWKRGKMARILIVDDDAAGSRTLELHLKSQGHRVAVQHSVDQGIAAARQAPPELVIMDIRMGGMNALETLRRLRQLDAKLPVIMITGNEGSRHKAYAELLGVTDYIQKPFAMSRLISAVDKMLDK